MGMYKVGSEGFVKGGNVDGQSVRDPTMRCDVEPSRGALEDAMNEFVVD